MGCIGLLIVVLFLGTFAVIAYRITESELVHDEHRARFTPDDAIGPEFTTMEDQLAKAHDEKRVVTQIRLEHTPEPLVGLWSVKEVGYEIALFDGPAGVLTLRIAAIVGIQLAPAQRPAPTGASPEGVPGEPQVEK